MSTMITTSTKRIPTRKVRKSGGDELGSDHPDRGQPGHLHQDRLRKPQVAECHSTSSIFRGYSIFMKGKDPRDAHFITSRICGICGDNHATCATYAQNMAFGVKPPRAGRVDRQPRRSRRVHVRPQHLPGQPGRRGLLRADGEGDQSRRAGPRPRRPRRRTPICTATAPSPTSCGAQSVHRLVLSRSAADEPHDARDVLPDGRPPRAPSTLYPGRRRHVPTVQLFTDYSCADEVRRVHEEGRAAARRPVRLLLRGAARLRRRSASGASCWAAGDRSTIPTSATTPTRT
jgi:hypothetical protein